MSVTFYFHPLSSYCHKALIALYETNTPFTPAMVDLGNEESRAAFQKIWPLGKFPVIRDEARGHTVAESTVIIEYLAPSLIPQDRDLAWQTRMQDRFFDNYVHAPMQAIVADRLRPADKRDAFGVEQMKANLRKAYGLIEHQLSGKTWAMGHTFTLADCAAAPALFYGDMMMPIAPEFPRVAAYLERLKNRPSYARVLKEAEPYFAMVPKG